MILNRRTKHYVTELEAYFGHEAVAGGGTADGFGIRRA